MAREVSFKVISSYGVHFRGSSINDVYEKIKFFMSAKWGVVLMWARGGGKGPCRWLQANTFISPVCFAKARDE